MFHKNSCRSVPLLWQLYAGPSLRTHSFNRVPIRVATWTSVVDKTVLKRVFSPPEYLSFCLVIIIQLVPDANSFIADAICLISALDSVVK